MTIAGFSLPALSEYDPTVAGEGSLDPMGLAAISDRLADRLAPGVRARMLKIRFVTAMAVGATACESLLDQVAAADGVSTPSIGFEWLVVEAFTRRLPAGQMPGGVPGSQKARTVVNRQQRLSAATYLKGPSVFGFNGVYKPFAIDTGVVGEEITPGPRCTALLRAWEAEQGLEGFADAVPGTEGARLRSNIREQVRDSLQQGHCTTKPGSSVFGQLARSLHPDQAAPLEREVLRRLVTATRAEGRAELAEHLARLGDQDLTEAQSLDAVRPGCSRPLRDVIDAVIAYEQFAALVDASFRTLLTVSRSMGAQPLTPRHVEKNLLIVECADKLPAHYRRAAERMEAIDAGATLETRLGEFAIQRTPGQLVELLIEHHERVQAAKPPTGKRPWFEPLRNGLVVRPGYGTVEQPELGPWFVHPVRVATLRRFMRDTAG